MKALSVLTASMLLVGATVVAQAAPLDPFVVTLQEETGAASCGGASTCVVATGNGEFNLSGLTLAFTSPVAGPNVQPSGPEILLSAGTADIYTGVFSGPSNFGSGSGTLATSSSGPLAAFVRFVEIAVPTMYTSGSAITDAQDIFANQTLATLGITPGSYTWTWGGTNHTADQSFTIDATPLPAALPLFATGIGALGLLGWRRKRKAQAVG